MKNEFFFSKTLKMAHFAQCTRLFLNVTKVENSQADVGKSFVSAWKIRNKNLKFFFRKLETAAGPNTGPKIWSKNPSSKFFKKKLFFLAMFKNEITTFKKKKFWNFRFFLKIFFQKTGHNFFHGPIFFMKFFFSSVYFFLTRSKITSDIIVLSEEVAEKCTWKSRFRRSSPINTLIKCGKRLQVANLQESTWNFFERHFYTQRNVLNT